MPFAKDETTPTKGRVVRLSVTGFGVATMDGLIINDPKGRVDMRVMHPSHSRHPLSGAHKWYEIKRVEQTANGWYYPVVALFAFPGDASRYIQRLIAKYKLDQEKPHE